MAPSDGVIKVMFKHEVMSVFQIYIQRKILSLHHLNHREYDSLNKMRTSLHLRTGCQRDHPHEIYLLKCHFYPKIIHTSNCCWFQTPNVIVIPHIQKMSTSLHHQNNPPCTWEITMPLKDNKSLQGWCIVKFNINCRFSNEIFWYLHGN